MTRRIGTIIALVLAGLVIAVATAWGALVLYYLAPGSAEVRTAAAWSFAALGLAALVALFVRRTRRLAGIGFAAAFALVLLVWSSDLQHLNVVVEHSVLDAEDQVMALQEDRQGLGLVAPAGREGRLKAKG